MHGLETLSALTVEAAGRSGDMQVNKLDGAWWYGRSRPFSQCFQKEAKWLEALSGLPCGHERAPSAVAYGRQGRDARSVRRRSTLETRRHLGLGGRSRVQRRGRAAAHQRAAVPPSRGSRLHATKSGPAGADLSAPTVVDRSWPGTRPFRTCPLHQIVSDDR